MKLMTKEIAKKLFKNDQQFIATGDTAKDVVVKYFAPVGAATWFIVSGTPVNVHGHAVDNPDDAADWHLFGRCDLYGDGGELGYVMLSDLESIKFMGGHLGIERDLGYRGTI